MRRVCEGCSVRGVYLSSDHAAHQEERVIESSEIGCWADSISKLDVGIETHPQHLQGAAQMLWPWILV